MSTTSDDPVVIDRDPEVLEGDDIVVEPSPPSSTHPRRRARMLLVGVVVAALLVTGVAVAVANRGSDGASKLQTAAPVSPPAAHPTPTKASAVTPAVKPKPIPKPAPAKVEPKPVNGTPPVANPTPTVASTPVVMPPPPPPVNTTPVESPPSVLQWKATPPALSMKAGTSKSFTVTVTNPTDGTVNLPHPLSCPPTLLRANGEAVGFMVCTEMVQVMQPHEALGRHYTIYATKTADASGEPLIAGDYRARIENLFDVKVTVTKA